PVDQDVIENLLDQNGEATGIRLEMTDVWNGKNNTGGVQTGSLLYPSEVMASYFQVKNIPTDLTFKNLTIGQPYTIRLMSSIAGANSNTQFTINDETKTVYVDNNEDQLVSFIDILPSDLGEIVLTTVRGPNNNIGVLNAIQLEYSEGGDSPTSPAVPTGFAGVSSSSNTIDLSWNAVDAANEYEIKRNDETAPFITLDAGVINYRDEGLSPGTTYTYRIRSKNDAGTSAYTDGLDVTTLTDNSQPNPPENISTLILARDVILIRWESTDPTVTEFVLEKSDDNGVTYTPVVLSDPLSTMLRDELVTPETPYIYRVKLINDQGESGFVTSSNVTTSYDDGYVPDDVELAVLREFYENLVPDFWVVDDYEPWPTLDSWPEYTNIQDFGSWYGITNYLGDIGEINMSYSNLSGEIPASLGNLKVLYRLDLISNNLEGQLPEQLFDTESRLEELLLNENINLGGVFPTVLMDVYQLKTLYLTGCSFTTIPDLNLVDSDLSLHVNNNHLPFTFLEIGSFLTDFRYTNQTSPSPEVETINYVPGQDAVIPNDMGGGVHTTYNWEFNDGTGWSSVADQSRINDNGDLTVSTTSLMEGFLYRCVMTNTRLTGTTTSGEVRLALDPQGTVPDVLELTALRQFFEGTNGPNWTSQTDANLDNDWPEGVDWDVITSLEAAVNWHGITITDGDVTGVSLSTNNLEGTILDSFANLGSLLYLSLHNNNLTGPIPSNIGDLSNLIQLTLSSNGFSGPIPPSIGSLLDLQTFNAGNNQLTEPIPDSFGNLLNLISLDMDNNSFSGTLPETLGDMPSLTRLDFSDNQITNIPNSLRNLPQLEVLDLNSNVIVGTIPSGLGDISTLIRINLSDNLLNGAIPLELGQLDDLYYLSLERNDLEGIVPPQLGPLSDLRIIRLSNNRLEGSLPNEWTANPNIEDLWIAENEFTSFQDFTAHPNVSNLDVRIENNYIPQADIDANLPGGTIVFQSFTYSPQKVPIYTYYAIANGDWTDGTIWSLEEGGAPANNTPITGDKVVIKGHTVTASSVIESGNITINANDAAQLILSGSGTRLTVAGTISIEGDYKFTEDILVVKEGARLECIEE
ncbi:MAG: leucine-rich repeat domain-containing protein, partial [Bacteroidota bacterium]